MIQSSVAAGTVQQRQQARAGRMRALVLPCLIALLCLLPFVPAGAQQIRPGAYEGVSENDKPIRFDLEFAPEGFEITMSMPELKIDRLFEKQGNQTIYRAVTPGILSMFGSERTAQPLDGDPLIWARDDSETFILYSMRIDQKGHFQLFHIRMMQNDDGIVAEIEHRTHGMDTVKDRAILKQL